MSLFIYLLLTDIEIRLFSHHLPLIPSLILLGRRMAMAISQFWLHCETSQQFPYKSGSWGDCWDMYVYFQFSHQLNCWKNIYLFLQMGPCKYSQEQRFCYLPEYSSTGMAHATLRIISFPRTWTDLRQMKLFHTASSKVFFTFLW